MVPDPISTRRMSLDVLRGATIAGMILVNNPGSWGHIYSPLRHAAWHGCTPTDLVFPFFLFMVGVAIPLGLGKRLDAGIGPGGAVPKVLRRGVVLFALGLLLAGFPKFDLGTIRVMGVLQRISVCYVLAALLYLYVSARTIVIVGAACLLAYWPLVTLVPVPGLGEPSLGKEGPHLVGWLDRTVLGAHVWRGGTYDPEGLLSTIPALATALIGVLAGMRLRAIGGSGRLWPTFIPVGLAMVGIGLLWGHWFPINKPLWTSSYAVYTGGLAVLALAVCSALFDGTRGPLMTAAARPFRVYGVNALLVFVGSGLLGRVVGRLWKLEDGRSAQKAFYDGLQSFGLSELNASLGYALIWILGWYLVLEVLYRRKIFLRV
ncbi:MAG: putative acyltransferase [Planctomycetota bacterium]